MSLTWPVPSGFMVHTSAAVKAPFTKAILSPAGDHTGRSSTLGPVLVRLVTPDPSAFILKISSSELMPVRNTSWVPLGDQSGSISTPLGGGQRYEAGPVRRHRGDVPVTREGDLAPSGDQAG